VKIDPAGLLTETSNQAMELSGHLSNPSVQAPLANLQRASGAAKTTRLMSTLELMLDFSLPGL
jgi:hypothetical protein